MYPADEDQVLSPQNLNSRLEKLKRHALYLLTRRDHTRHELTEKLLHKGYTTNEIDTILTRLEETGLIDNTRFAEIYASYRRANGYGPKRIAMELQAKGVPDTVIAEQVKITDNAWFTEIKRVWRKQFKGHYPSGAAERAKQQRYLYNRGYTQNQINSLLKNIDEQDE